jgi:hypothetical protein
MFEFFAFAGCAFGLWWSLGAQSFWHKGGSF